MYGFLFKALLKGLDIPRDENYFWQDVQQIISYIPKSPILLYAVCLDMTKKQIGNILIIMCLF